MLLELAHAVIGDPDAPPGRTAFILHGILGSSRNWRSFARRMAAAWPGWRLVLVDLRGHGGSHPADPPNTLAACAADLDRLAERLGRPSRIVGHSFGGKTALMYARNHGEGLEQAWVLDALPGPGTDAETASDVELVIAALRAIPLPLARREDLKQRLMEMGFSEMLAGWMTTNLRSGEGGLVWRFDLDAVEALLADYQAADLWPFMEDPGCAIHVVRAERSDRWTGAVLRRLHGLPRVSLHTLRGSGHWVHVENPEGLLAILAGGFADTG